MTSGMFALGPLSCLLETSTIENVVCRVDHPFSTDEKGKQLIEELQRRRLTTVVELDMFAHRNAE
jgi:hypothetical protein